MKPLTLISALLFASLFSTPLYGQDEDGDAEYDFQLELKFDNRTFFNDGAYPGQQRNFISVAAEPEYELRWKDGTHTLKAHLFGRWDQFDDNRSHADIRELYYQYVANDWEVSVGAKKIFWGVTESAHLVDIINQTDQVESFDGEQKLGQPMVHFSYLSTIGTFDVFYLPYARRRQFPSRRGRFRFSEVIEKENIRFDSNAEEWHAGFAFRWSHYFGPFDVGTSYFYGPGREPLFQGADATTGELQLIYPVIHQTGVDVQATTGPFLWKLEGIYRYADLQDFVSLAAGFEYTFGNIASTGLDIGLIGEYLYDSRDELTFSSLDNDVFVGARFALHDVSSTELLAGAIFDLEQSTSFISAEGSRRFGESWKAELELRLFENVSIQELAYFFRQDDFVQLRISKFF